MPKVEVLLENMLPSPNSTDEKSETPIRKVGCLTQLQTVELRLE